MLQLPFQAHEIVMMISKLLRLIRRSSNSGISHSRSTICVWSNLMTPCNFSISIIRPRSCSFSASYTELSLLRSLDLSLASILGKTIAKFLIPKFLEPNRVQWFQTFQTGQFLQAFYTLKNSDNLPGNQTNGRGSRLSKHPLHPKDLLQTSACHPSHRTDFSLPNSFQGRLSESSLSKHLTCVSGTYSQPQLIAILSIFISRQVVGAFTVQNTSLVSPGLTPNLSLSRYSKNFKTCHLWQSLDKSPSTNDLTVNMPKSETKTHIISIIVVGFRHLQ